MKRWTARALTVLLFVSFIQDASARVLNLHKDWIGFELFGSYHLLSDYGPIRKTINESVTHSPAKKSQNLDAGLHFIFTFSRVRARTGLLYAQPLNYNATGTNCFTASVSSYSLAGVVGVDVGMIQTEGLRVHVGAFGGMSLLNRAKVDYTFSGGCTDASRVENLKAGMKPLYGGHVGVEYGIFSRMSIGADIGYLYHSISGWKAVSELPAGDLRPTTVAKGGDAVIPGLSKTERLGGLFFRFTMRSYF